MGTAKENSDVTNIGKHREQERTKRLKELWKQALYRTIKRMGNEAPRCSDQELGNWSLGVTFRDKIFKEQMEVDFPEEYPLGSSFEVIGFDDLQAYLRSELNSFFQ